MVVKEKTSKKNYLTEFPDLVKEWHFGRNRELKIENLTSGSNRRVWWKCSKEKDHEWEATIAKRTAGGGCPYCSGRRASKTNNLAINSPELVKEWHPTRNKELTPYDVKSNSRKKVWWKCQKGEGHEWEAVVSNRTRGRGCPKCHKKGSSYPEYALCYFLTQNKISFVHRYKSKHGEVDVYLPQFNLAIEYNGEYFHRNRRKQDEEKYLKIAQEHELVLINEDNLATYSYLNKGNLKHRIIQIYNKDSRKRNYDYVDEIFDILNLKSVLEVHRREHKNILSTMQCMEEERNISSDKYIVSKWNFKKNKSLNPKFFSHGSGERVWWKCTEGHEWKTSISHITRGGGCPYCAGVKVDPKNNFASVNQVVAKEWHPTKNGALKPSDVTCSSNRKVWWKCDKGEDHEWEVQISHRSRGSRCPFCLGRRLSKTNSLMFKNPELAKEWHPTKNSELTPNDVVSGSNKKVWWLCNVNQEHEWEAAINDRNRGTGCPFCRK